MSSTEPVTKLPPLLSILRNIPLFVVMMVKKYKDELHNITTIKEKDIDKSVFYIDDELKIDNSTYFLDMYKLVDLSKQEFEYYGVKIEKGACPSRCFGSEFLDGEPCIKARRFYDYEIENDICS